MMNEVDDCICSAEQNDNGGYQVKKPMLYYLFQMNRLIYKISKSNPYLRILKSWRVHDGIIEKEFAELHKLVYLLN